MRNSLCCCYCSCECVLSIRKKWVFKSFSKLNNDINVCHWFIQLFWIHFGFNWWLQEKKWWWICCSSKLIPIKLDFFCQIKNTWTLLLSSSSSYIDELMKKYFSLLKLIRMSVPPYLVLFFNSFPSMKFCSIFLYSFHSFSLSPIEAYESQFCY